MAKVALSYAYNELGPQSVTTHLQAAGMARPYVLVAVARLSFSARIVHGNNAAVLCAAYADRHNPSSWMAALEIDLLWLNDMAVSAKLCTYDSLSKWFTFAAVAPGKAKAHVKRCLFQYMEHHLATDTGATPKYCH